MRWGRVGALTGLLASLVVVSPVRVTAGSPTPTSPTEPGNLVILIDESGSLGGSDFANEKALVAGIVNGLPDQFFGPSGSVALVGHATTARTVLPPNGSRSAVLNALGNMTQTGGSSCLNCGITASTTILSSLPVEERRVVIMLADGPDSDPTTLANAIAASDAAGVWRIVAAWSTGAASPQMDQIDSGSGPFLVEESSDLDEMASAITVAAAFVPARNSDSDTFSDYYDNCDAVANEDQVDTDEDTAGDACDANDDADGLLDVDDSCRVIAATTASGCPLDVASLTLKYSAKKRMFKGTLTSSIGACLEGRVVSVSKQTSSGPAFVGAVPTQSTGVYKLRKRARRGTYIASIDVTVEDDAGECSAQTATKKVR
ncbi:MAG: vWA domain-containing protein [Actinomycetota bacterium]